MSFVSFQPPGAQCPSLWRVTMFVVAIADIAAMALYLTEGRERQSKLDLPHLPPHRRVDYPHTLHRTDTKKEQNTPNATPQPNITAS